VWQDGLVLRWWLPLALVVALVSSAGAGVFKPRGQQKSTAAKKAPVTAKKAPAKQPAKRVVTKAPAKKKQTSRVAEKGKARERDEVTVVDSDDDEEIVIKDE
jgi:hypothetical protein